MSINHIVTPLDSAVLETKEQYKVYFKIVNHAFSELVAKISQHDICTEMEATFLEQYCELFIYSLEAFRVKYLFDDEEKMKVDLTESGYPNYLEFRYLLNDLELKNEHISKLPKVKELKIEFLETLIKDKEPISERKLHQAASIVYYNSVEQRFIFKRFVQGKIIANPTSSEAEFLVSWSFYDVTYNRPFICFMYFDLHKTTLSEYTHEIYNLLESVADRDMDLDMMAYAVDKKLPKVLPKRFKKIDFGPFHNVFAKDELEITHVILKAIIDKNLDLSAFALSLKIDSISSKGDFSEGNIFNKQQLQIWEAAKPEKYLFTTHRVMQTLYDQIPETVNALTQQPIEIADLKL
ncbi:hypothetical protein [Ulvibacter antarcticus]|uniref:Uncharacterized protein n=1 Tax=Ulvibacter antarcticus TaxID=442714 RepID=A0A3L9YGZ6_9FLAO|nr:hypothetical protein [Ulvibacter antarcticus]RMA57158.1 hypothetical protein BXY75_3045 [Ulvibacter antarcticus]